MTLKEANLCGIKEINHIYVEIPLQPDNITISAMEYLIRHQE